jgi:hypothetical protein
MLLIDRKGERPVCVSCHRLGPYRTAPAERSVFVCEECIEAADERIQQVAESVPELRDHRLKRWREGCNCEQCHRRSRRAV